MDVNVRPAHRRDIAGLSRVLAEAFDDDPVMTWMLPDPQDRAARMSRFFAAITRHHHLKGGGVEVATDNADVIGGAALWDPPNGWQQSTVSTVTMLPSIFRALGRRSRVGARLDEVMDAVHPKAPHWYLSTIGTGSAARGGGYGTTLMKSRLDRCDDSGASAYLESSKESNIPYYERFGFTVTREIVVPDGGPTLYAMWRDAR